MGICIISRFAFAGRFTGGGVPVTLPALHYPPMKRCSAVALFESSPCQHKKQTPCRDTARGLLFYGAVRSISELEIVSVLFPEMLKVSTSLRPLSPSSYT